MTTVPSCPVSISEAGASARSPIDSEGERRTSWLAGRLGDPERDVLGEREVDLAVPVPDCDGASDSDSEPDPWSDSGPDAGPVSEFDPESDSDPEPESEPGSDPDLEFESRLTPDPDRDRDWSRDGDPEREDPVSDPDWLPDLDLVLFGEADPERDLVEGEPVRERGLEPDSELDSE